MKDKKLGKKEIDKAMIPSDKLRSQILDTINDFQDEHDVGAGFVITAMMQLTADVAIHSYCNINNEKFREFMKKTTDEAFKRTNKRFAEIDAENNEEA